MQIEDVNQFVDMVAQAVVDRIEERQRISTMVEMVSRRVIELQQERNLGMEDNDGRKKDCGCNSQALSTGKTA